ncbi:MULTISPECIES: hypothetical protein [Sanguibacteroides]|uniref:Major fimbrial subunit protein N-terminal domain-containing protein n=2 Tax=Sanguibacteroides justesenii TaxID=1547597 RepID=A0AB34R1P4_9PORP|nr:MULTISPECIES: hypothetical protein [Sanguibacteroides]KIO43160.1 hypothetical protein IE90_13205 [Sanguibacteroides justesenii]PXZ43086.1 hypothetical protein DMB45_11870 [Sanguibacteroides justesenii]
MSMLKKIYLLLSAITLFWCCHSPVSTPEPEETYIYIRLSTPKEKTVARSVSESGEDPLQENKIDEMVFFFVRQEGGEKKIIVKITRTGAEVTTALNGNGLITIPVSALSDLNPTDNIWVYALANFDHTDITPPTELSVLENKLTDEKHAMNNAPNTLFIMETHNNEAIPYNINRYPFIALSLKRIAVKIRLRFTLATPLKADGTPEEQWKVWKNENIELKRQHFSTRSRVVEDPLRPLSTSTINHQDLNSLLPGITFSPPSAEGVLQSQTSTILYTLENPWNDRGEESFITLQLPYIDQNNILQANNYYKIPLSDRAIARNSLFDIQVIVRELGANNPQTATPLTGNRIEIKEWTFESSDVTVVNDFIQVSKTEGEFTGTSFDFKLKTNRFPVITAIDNNNAPVTVLIPPSYSLANENRIEATLPSLTSFTPTRGITVSITSGILEKKLTFRQYPNSSFQEATPGVPDFTVFESRVGEGDVDLSIPVTTHGVTEPTAGGNKKISPRFQIYIHGQEVTGGTTPHHPDEIARNLTVPTIDGRPGWRVPTVAELQLIYKALEAEYTPGTPNRTVAPFTNLVSGASYWSARQLSTGSSEYTIVNLTDNTTSTGNYATSARLICVHDITK